MNRELKFRAWNGKSMHSDFSNDFISFQGKHYVQADDVNDTPHTEVHEHIGVSVIMQFAGLKDKNGKEIYEGDIIREKNIGHLFDEIITRTVVYGNGGFFAKEGNGSCFLGNINLRYEVIGNIYENPELLK